MEGGRSKLAEIPGLVPSLRKPIQGCAFHGRCQHPMRNQVCIDVAPAVEEKDPGHAAACHYAEHSVPAGRIAA